MYKYDAIDRQLITERVEQFRDQVRRWKAGELSDDEFRPLRLQNGLYIQRHAPMFRIAVPYAMMNSAQLRKLAFVGPGPRPGPTGARSERPAMSGPVQYSIH